jgi:hypothetical protein
LTFRLPKPGRPAQKAQNGKPARPAREPEGDPFFGFSRSFYYAGEQRGYWKLIRIRNEGKDRGAFQDVLRFVQSKMNVPRNKHALCLEAATTKNPAAQQTTARERSAAVAETEISAAAAEKGAQCHHPVEMRTAAR